MASCIKGKPEAREDNLNVDITYEPYYLNGFHIIIIVPLIRVNSGGRT